MSCSLDTNWDSCTWPQRYMISSMELNYILVNNKRLFDSDNHWTVNDASDFISWIDQHSAIVQESMILYRGTWDTNVPYWSASKDDSINLNIISTSKKERIAKEFSRAPVGYVHTLHLHKGCKVLDLKDYYQEGDSIQEEEVLLCPGHRFELVRRRGSDKHWNVTPN
jgi:hypothetical protein